jgi:hypothetical protein
VNNGERADPLLRVDDAAFRNVVLAVLLVAGVLLVL